MMTFVQVVCFLEPKKNFVLQWLLISCNSQMYDMMTFFQVACLILQIHWIEILFALQCCLSLCLLLLHAILIKLKKYNKDTVAILPQLPWLTLNYPNWGEYLDAPFWICWFYLLSFCDWIKMIMYVFIYMIIS